MANKNSQTTHKWLLKIQRVGGHLPEVVAYKGRTAGGLLLGEIWKHLPFGENVLETFLDNNNISGAPRVREARACGRSPMAK